MLVVLCDLIADISMHVPRLPIEAGDIQRLHYLDIGPGGAGNAAIMAARFGLPVTALGELGDDTFGAIVRDGLAREGIHTQHIHSTPTAATPVAGVLVGTDAEPAYLGTPGSLQMEAIHADWLPLIDAASALYADGWAEHAGVTRIVLAGLQRARARGIPTFFDPGPGNPDVPEDWITDAIRLTTVLLLNETEALRFSGQADSDAAAAHFLASGPSLVVIKRGPAGCVLYRAGERVAVPGFPVEVVDHTGAGDSLSGALIYAVLNELPLEQAGQLGNATGAAKVQKRGTGHSMPTLHEIRALLERHALNHIPLPDQDIA